MIVQCPQCQARYHYAEDRFAGGESKRLRCFACTAVWEVIRPASVPEPEQPPDGAEQDAPIEELLETTLRTRERAHGEELPDEPPPPPRRRRKTAASRPEPPLDIAAVRAEGDPRLPAGYRLSLAVINADGPDAGKVFRLEQPRIVIGRAEGDVGLDDDEISRQHAVIEVRDSIILLEDLGSTNGTFHKGKALDAPVPLYNHSEFLVGNTTLMLIVTRE